MEFVYFGHDVLDAYVNAALDEIMLDLTAATKKGYLRFHEYKRAALILAYVQHPSDIIIENSDGFDLTRRITQGGVMLGDANALYFSLTVPTSDYDLTTAHRTFGGRAAEVLKEYVKKDEVHLGKHFSVRINGRTIIGSGQRATKDAVLYHGAIAVMPWNMQKIASTITMDNEEKIFVENLPSLQYYSPGVKKEDLAQRLLTQFTGGSYTPIEPDEKERILELAKELGAKKYRSPEWIEFGPYYDRKDESSKNLLLKGWGFCFADVKSPEPLEKQI